jgi:Mce-associated membrane protein
MTKPHSDDADAKSHKPERESAAVRVRADAASEQDTAKAEATEPVESEANEPEDPENTVGAEDSGEVDTTRSDDAEVEQKPQGVEPGKAKRRIRQARAGDVKGRRGGEDPQPRARPLPKAQSRHADDGSDQRDEESREGEAKEPSDAPDLSDALDSDEPEAAASDDADTEEGEPAKVKRRVSWSRVLVYGVLPGLALVLTAAAGFFKWQDSSARAAQLARIESVAAAKDSTIALLSYKADTVEKDLEAAKNRMTGAFKDSYSQLINDVVIPGSKREHVSTTATVPAAASVSATPNHAVTLLFVNQTAVVGKDPPTDTTSSVRVTLDKIGGRWLISGFDPV